MKILVVGSGAREHAIAKFLSFEQQRFKTPKQHELFSIGGNPGIWQLTQRFERIDETDGERIAEVAKKHQIDLVVIGPEAPLAAGATDILQSVGLCVFGPTKDAAELEASKSFAKEVMTGAGVPTAKAVKCENMQQLVEALRNADQSNPFVVKADGLMAGKGVIVTSKKSEAEKHASDVFHNGGFVILEEYLDGPEFSQFFICDGKTALPLPPAQDFKRIFNDDQGPNTGGMGAYSPLEWLPSDAVEWTRTNVAQPVIEEMAKMGAPFVGILFAGLAYTSKGIKVIEFNVRFGDPETQVVLERLNSSLADLMFAATQGKLSLDSLDSQTGHLPATSDSVVNVVLASAGYPESSHKGDIISLPQVPAFASILQAGTGLNSFGELITNGGRVLSVLGTGKDIETARKLAYEVVEGVHFDGKQNRTDIALKAAMSQISV